MLNAFVLAAGLSSRAGQSNKLLLQWKGRSVIEHVVSNLSATNRLRIVVVTGHDESAVSRALADLPVELLHNPNYKDGIGSTVSVAARCHAGTHPEEPLLLMPGDMPLVTTDLIQEVMQGWRGPQDIVRPMSGELPGHPVLFGSAWLNSLAALSADRGARAIIDSNRQYLKPIPVRNPSDLTDIDTESDLKQLHVHRFN